MSPRHRRPDLPPKRSPRLLVTSALGVTTALAFTGALVAALVTGGVTPLHTPRTPAGLSEAPGGVVRPPDLLVATPR